MSRYAAVVIVVSQKMGPIMRRREIPHTLHTHLISHGTDVLLLKFRCNIFISIRVINEMPCSAPSETPVSKMLTVKGPKRLA
jgi:hypothetical protein